MTTTTFHKYFHWMHSECFIHFGFWEGNLYEFIMSASNLEIWFESTSYLFDLPTFCCQTTNLVLKVKAKRLNAINWAQWYYLSVLRKQINFLNVIQLWKLNVKTEKESITHSHSFFLLVVLREHIRFKRGWRA